MPLIQFDPPDESQPMKQPMKQTMSGGLPIDKSIRTTYFTLSNQLFQSGSNGEKISGDMLHIMNDEARKHIESLPEAHRPGLYKTLDLIMGSIDPAETNYSGLLMIVALQLSLLFTKYVYRIKDKPAYLQSLGMNGDVFTFTMFETVSFADQSGVYHDITEDVWTNYSSVKKIIEDASADPSRLEVGEGVAGTLFILYPERGIWKYLPMMGSITFKEIVDSIFQKIWYVGLAFEPNYVDGAIETPLGYYIHDIGHSIDLASISDTPEMQKTMKMLREFRDFLYATHKLPPVIYSVYFVLFYMLHELGYEYTFGFFNPVSITSHLEEGEEGEKRLGEYIKKLLDTYVDAGILLDLRNGGRAIPAQYRHVLKDPNMIDKEWVKMYVDLACVRYMECWREFQATRGRVAQGGKRTRRTRRNRRSKGRSMRR